LFNYIFFQITGYRGWILQQYNVAAFRNRLEALLVSNFTSQTLREVDVLSKADDREVYCLKVHMEDQTTPGTSEKTWYLLPQEIYIKRYYTINWKQKIQTLLHVHKAQKSWRIGKDLVKRGIPTPLPIAYLTKKANPPLRGVGGCSVEHILITQGIENGVRLSDYVRHYVQMNPELVHKRLSLSEKRELIQRVAEFLAKLHTEGIYHGDFTTRNILVEDIRQTPPYSPQGGTTSPFPPSRGESSFRVYLIDLDSVRSTHWILDRRRIKNLDELGRNFLNLQVFSTTDRGRFLKHYLRANPKETRTFKQLFRCVFERTQKRLRKYGKYFSPPPNLPHQGGGMYEALPCQEGGTYRNWNLHVFPQWKEVFPDINTICNVLSNPEQIVQENNRGVVLLTHHNGTYFVAKRSKIQENRYWAQFTSLYRQGEGTRTLRNIRQLCSLGLPVPEPVLVLEKKVGGFVVASWSLYRYLEGRQCDRTQAHLIAKILKEIHQKGWVHRDPHVKNFLLNREQIYIIDCAKARPWRSRYAQMYDVVLLNNCCPGSLKYYGISESYWVYRLAKFHNNMIKLWRRIKRQIRPNTYRKRKHK
jgi:tRNA A-37 threonylcarbamoyl transferase component Bud32